jgi:hypothetical protein
MKGAPLLGFWLIMACLVGVLILADSVERLTKRF